MNKSIFEKREPTPEESDKYIKLLCYFSFFIFGISLVFSILALTIEDIRSEITGLFSVVELIIEIIIAIIGIVCSYYLLKQNKRWALITLIVIAALSTIGALTISITMGGQMQIPITKMVYLTLTLMGLKYIKIRRSK
ncbi:hypothetical protein HYY69_00185 [Candidatus Woesearchaeota archaeon]|nr:hypothetical protein [Candidatus Woesearchaeota archaeon]